MKEAAVQIPYFEVFYRGKKECQQLDPYTLIGSQRKSGVKKSVLTYRFGLTSL